jgi:hypothetical protein
MKNRYVFPIFNLKNNIIGFSGRDTTNISKIKWKHLGEKSDFLYPLFLNDTHIKTKKEIKKVKYEISEHMFLFPFLFLFTLIYLHIIFFNYYINA